MFSQEARFQFDPIAKDFSLACVAFDDFSVRYESNKVFLVIHYDYQKSYEVAVEIGKLSVHDQAPGFSLSEILRLRNARDVEFVDGLMITDAAYFPDFLSRLAKLTSMYATDFLAGNEFSFAQAQQLRKKESAELETRSRLRFARSKVSVAWQVKDYEAVIKFFEPLEAHLSAAEKKKLDYARGKITN
jgi:hypothetical protein